METLHQARILVIDDDPQILEALRGALTMAGFTIDVASNGRDGFRLACQNLFDALIIDLMLPDMDGLEVLQHLREQAIDTPVLILSGKDHVEDRVAGLNTGADDYLVKPFAFAELLARVHSLLRRVRSSQPITRLQVADLNLDLVARRAFRGDDAIDLRPVEFHILEFLMRRPGEVVGRQDLLQHVWGYSTPSSTNVVEVHICRLREKIERAGQPQLIHTIRGVGYVLKADIEDHKPS
jgi:two-component system, OmpR family, response regulator